MKRMLNEQKGGFFYSLASIVPVVVSLIFGISMLAVKPNGTEEWYLYAQFLLTQIPFAILIFVYSKKEKLTLLDLGLNKTKAKYFLLAILVEIGVFFALGKANEWFVGVLHDLFGYEAKPVTLPSLDGFGLVGVLFVVGLLPAICEELIFRGIMVNSTKGLGFIFCIFVNGALFSLFHENPAQTIYQFVCGCLFALVAYKSGSVLPTMLIHVLNNTAIVLFQKAGISTLSGTWYNVTAVISAFILVGAIVLLVRDQGEEKREGERKKFFISASLGIFVCVLFWLANFISS